MLIPLEIIKLSKTYDRKEAVKNISFRLNKNEIIGILGPNGCGKTTTIGMILGLLKPTEGKVLINGLNIGYENLKIKQHPCCISLEKGSYNSFIITQIRFI